MINQAQLTHELRALVQAELQPRETIIWQGQPIPRRLAFSTLPLVLFGIPWTAFSIFWVTMAFSGTRAMKGSDAMSTGFRYFFPLFGVPFVLIGLGMLSAPYWSMRKARATVYVITNQRAIAFEGGWRTTVRSYLPGQLRQLERRQNKDASGDIILGQTTWRDSDGDRRNHAFGFLGIPNVREVESLLTALASHANPPGEPPKLA